MQKRRIHALYTKSEPLFIGIFYCSNTKTQSKMRVQAWLALDLFNVRHLP
jgi:hypothetical protein